MYMDWIDETEMMMQYIKQYFTDPNVIFLGRWFWHNNI